MCATYTYTKDVAKLALLEKLIIYGVLRRGVLRPTGLGPVIVPEFEGLAARAFRWGWSVPWDKKPLINAKAETLTSLPTYQPHLAQRCLLPADGFFEGGVRFFQPGEPLFCFAGLWQTEAEGTLRRDVRSSQRDAPTINATIHTYTLLTTTPNESVAKYHDRMPFIVRPADYADWLRGDWERVLQSPDKSPLEKFEQQPELF